MTKPYRKLDKLDPKFRLKVVWFLSEVKETHGNVIFVTESWRSAKRQSELRKKGLSKVKRSKHQDWLAIDIAFRGKVLYPKELATWRLISEIANKHGIDWWYDLWKWDKPHYQDNPKFKPLEEKQKLHNAYKKMINLLIKRNSKKYHTSKRQDEMDLLHKVNDTLRDMLMFYS